MECAAHQTNSFRLLDLPTELRQKIYHEFFGVWDATIEYDSSSGSFKVRGLPELDLLVVCRMIYVECCQLAYKSFSGRLFLKDARVARERGSGFVSSVDVMASVTPKWLLESTRLIAIDQGTTGMLMALPWYRFKMLQEINLEATCWPLTHCHHCGISNSLRKAQEKNVLEGKYDTWCVYGYNRWTQVPQPVAEGQVRIVTVKRGTIAGAFLKVRIEHRPEGAEVLDRTIDSVVQRGCAESIQKSEQKADLSCHPM